VKAVAVEQATVERQATAVLDPPSLIRDISYPFVKVRVRIQV